MVDTWLFFVRLALGKEKGCDSPSDIAWEELIDLADKQGVAAIVADGVEKLLDSGLKNRHTGFSSTAEIPKLVKLKLAGRAMIQEQTYRRHEVLMARLAKLYQKAGFRMMVLKGWGLSLDYPVPSHRPSGDLDIWNFGQWKEADAYLSTIDIKDNVENILSNKENPFRKQPRQRRQGNRIVIDNSHHHHSVFYVEELMVENHYDFINTHAHRSNKKYEEKIKELASRDYRETEVTATDSGQDFTATVYLPGSDFNFLFLLRHMASHFVGKGMSLRQLLDWALFVEHHHEEIDWVEDLAFLKENGLFRYYNLMALLCVKRLGFNPEIFHCGLKEDELEVRVFNDIIDPEYKKEFGNGPLMIMANKACRWWCNRWKHKLCYSDSLLSSFVFGVWAKIEKPSHFVH